MAITYLQLRRETYANWMSTNPILAEGEPAYETDTKRYKLGDGVTTYALLRYSTRYGTTSLGSKRGNITNRGEFAAYMDKIAVNTNLATITVTPYTHGATVVALGYCGGVFSPTQGRIYFAPYNQCTAAVWHYIDCTNGSVVAYTHGATVVALGYWGGVYDPAKNRIYMIPYTQSTAAVWHYIDCGEPPSGILGNQVSKWVMAGALFNKY